MYRKLDELISIEDQTEIVLQGAGEDLLGEIAALVGRSEGAELLRSGNRRTTLERLFLKETRAGSADAGDGS